MATVYKNNIPYSDNNGAVARWALDNAVGAVTTASITAVRVGHWDLTVNGSVIRSFAGAPSAMTALYELFKAGGGDDASFSAFSMTVIPAIDMTGVAVTEDDITITGHTWEDYSGSPEVVFYDVNNRELSRVSVTGSEVVAIPADTERIVVGSNGAIPVFYSAVTIPTYVFTADRRPMFIAAWASQKMSIYNDTGDGETNTNALDGQGNGQTWGVNNVKWRKAPAPGSASSLFTTPASTTPGVADGNGPLRYSEDLFKGAGKPVDLGFERFTFSFISGWTNLKDGVGTDNNPMPHYPSNPYSGLALTEALVTQQTNSTIDSFISETPFTPTGTQTGSNIKGDIEECWKVAVQELKDDIVAEGGTPEIICYAGYRPLYTDASMSTVNRSLLGYSVQADRGGWDGTGNSPGYTPTPGQNTYSASDEAFNDWWGYELNGLRNMGFDGIGLDTGAAMWWNANEMTGVGTGANGAEGSIPGSPRLYNLFYSYGIAAQVEAVNWQNTGNTVRPWGGADGTLDSNAGEIYEQGPAWGLAGTTLGWVGRTQDSHEIVAWNGESVAPGDGTLYANVYNRDGLSGSSTADHTTIGDPLIGGSKLPLIGPTGKGTEVHSIFRFNNSVVNALFTNFSWVAIQQIIWDYHNAGLIVGSGGSTTATVNDKDGLPVTAQMFNQYLMDLHTGAVSQRPGSDPPADPNVLPAGINARITKPAGSPTDLVATGNGWLRANNAYTTFQSATATVPTQDSNYPRIRVSGTGASRDCFVDVDFGSDAARTNFIFGENNPTQMCIRLEVQDANGVRIALAESDPLVTDGNPWPPDAGNSRVQVKLDVDDFIEGTAPEPGSSPTDWDGQDEGWVLDGGYIIEFFTP